MRKNHDRHARNQHALYDVVYTPMPEIGGTKTLTVHPLKTIYINTSARADAWHTREFRDFDTLLDFVARYGITLP